MVKCYLNYFLLYFKTLKEYKVDWIFSFIKIPILFTLYWFIWKTLYSHYGTSIGGYSFYGMLLYLFASQWIQFCFSFNLSEKIADDIRTGRLSIYLSRPIDYLPAQFFTYMGHVVFTVFVTILPFIILVWVLMNGKVSVYHLTSFLLTILTASFLHFLLESCLGSIGFWFHKIFGLHYLIMTFFSITGGRLLPLNLFPKWFEVITYFSPLRAIYYGPISVLFGQSLMTVIFLQLGWLVGLLGILFLLWRQGRLIYEAAG